jgi:hypothetical protein
MEPPLAGERLKGMMLSAASTIVYKKDLTSPFVLVLVPGIRIVRLYSLGCFTLGFSWRFHLYFRDVFEEKCFRKRELQKRRRGPFRRVVFFFHRVSGIRIPYVYYIINRTFLTAGIDPTVGIEKILADKIIRKWCKLVTFPYKNPGQQKCERMNNLLAVFQAKEILRSLMRNSRQIANNYVNCLLRISLDSKQITHLLTLLLH